MRVLACVKRVPAPGARIVLTANRTDIDTKNLGFTTSPHEECAVEEAMRLVELHGGTTTVLTVGPGEADEQLRYALSVGADHAALVPTDGGDWDAQATARALVDAIGSLETTGGPFDVIIMGNESADSGGFQVGVRVARALGRPMVNGIKGAELDGDVLVARRESGNGYEVYRLGLPAMIGVLEGINLPRYPTLPARLRSKKADVASIPGDHRPGGLVTGRFDTPVEQVSETTVLGHGPEAAVAVVDLLEEWGLV